MTIHLYGVERVDAALQELGARGPGELAAGLYQEGQAILATSQELYCPVDTGALRASGYVTEPVVDREIAVTIGYNTPYALATHENPRAGRTGGTSPSGKPYKHWATVGQWKYLETPFKDAVLGMVDRLTAFLRRAIDGVRP